MDSMTFVQAARVATASVALFCSTALAQGRFCLGGDLASLSPAERDACSAQLLQLHGAATHMSQMDGWHIVLVCGEQGWKDYSDFTGGSSPRLAEALYDVTPGQHEIFLRSEHLRSADARLITEMIQHATVERGAGDRAQLGE